MDYSFLPPTEVPFASRPRVTRVVLLLLFLFAFAIWFSSRALLSAGFLPHWYCFAGNGRLLWTTVISDLFIGLSYVVISATLVQILRRSGQDLPYQGFFWAFGLFIMSCGITHFLEIVTVWRPVYWLAAAAKILTAVSSVGTAIVLVAAAEDIISLVRTARQVATGRAQERFRALFMATPLAVLSLDTEGLITSWSPGAQKVFGFLEADVIGKLNPTVPPDLLSEHRRLLKNTLDGSITTGFETTRLRQDGTKISVSICCAPLFEPDGKQTGVMATIEDISERRRMELELREKSAILVTVTQALNLYLETGDWTVASRELLAFVMQQTRSEYGFLGVVLDRSQLRLLSHDGKMWDQPLPNESGEHRAMPEAGNGELKSRELHQLF